MKIYGYTKDVIEKEDARPSELVETTVVASPKELRKLASFLAEQATKMEKYQEGYEHEHLCDNYPSFRDCPGFVIYNPQHL